MPYKNAVLIPLLGRNPVRLSRKVVGMVRFQRSLSWLPALGIKPD